jgi:C1A family cysteine protease
MHVFNVRKDAPDHRDHLAAPAPAESLPPVVSLRPWLGPIKNQGQLGSCTAHAGTALREYLYRRFYAYERFKGTPAQAFRLSPLYLYAMERIMEGTFPEDSGADSRTIFKVLSQFGCAPESMFPYQDGSRALHLQPDAQTKAFAESYRSISYHRVLDVQTLKSVLASGYTATVGMSVYSELESDECARTGLLRIPTRSSTCLGGHEMHVVGYDDTKNVLGLVGAFDVQNSWGVEWGDDGHVWVPYAYFTVTTGWDFWTAHLGKPW